VLVVAGFAQYEIVKDCWICDARVCDVFTDIKCMVPGALF